MFVSALLLTNVVPMSVVSPTITLDTTWSSSNPYVYTFVATVYGADGLPAENVLVEWYYTVDYEDLTRPDTSVWALGSYEQTSVAPPFTEGGQSTLNLDFTEAYGLTGPASYQYKIVAPGLDVQSRIIQFDLGEAPSTIQNPDQPSTTSYVPPVRYIASFGVAALSFVGFAVLRKHEKKKEK